jgi:uncharacterized NAD(P)/FAD-binding protein YdhS
VIAVSRRGLLPRTHESSEKWPTPKLSAHESRSALRLLRRIRAEVRAAAAQNVGWRGVVDSLRPITAQIWSALPDTERPRFLRYLQPWWDVHRHRQPPPAAAALDRLRDAGRFEVWRGRIAGMTDTAAGVAVRVRRQGAAAPETVVVQRVIRASGLSNAADIRSPLVRNLIDRGLARFDPLGIGLDADGNLRVKNQGGETSDQLWALGPIVRGTFWECTAVPDIRGQADQIATRVVAAGISRSAPHIAMTPPLRSPQS